MTLSRGQANTATNPTMIVRQMDPKVYQKRANWAAFVVFLRLLTMKRRAAAAGRSGFAVGKGVKNCKNFKFEWSDIDVGSPTTLCATTINSAGVTLAVTTGTGLMFTINDLIYNRNTKELIRVTAISTDNLTVERGWGGSTAAAVTVGDVLVMVSGAHAEGASSPIARTTTPEEFYNYTQIFKRSVENSGTCEATEYYGDVNKLSFQKRIEWDQFLLERARAYFVGGRHTATDSVTGKPIRATGGLEFWIKSNLFTKSSMSYNYLMDFSEMLYAYGGEEKILVCNDALMGLIQKALLEQKIQTIVSPMTKEYGINVKRIETTFGSLDLMPDKTMKDLYGNVPTGFGLEPELLEEMVLRPDVWQENIQDNDLDGRKDQILGESGLKVITELRHAKIVIA